ncbi:MAG: relaxase/mobilization nuclease domain-containing protein [Eubacteriales bacterium]
MTIAIVKPIKVRSGNLAGLKGVLTYIQEDHKTEDGKLVWGKDLVKGKEFEQMFITKKMHQKISGRQYAHFVQSFGVDDLVTPEMAFTISKEFIKRNHKFDDFQVVSAVHTNEKHMHIHYIVNSVGIEKGEKWQCSPKDLEKMRNISDELCYEYGLSVIEHRGNFHQKYGEYKAFKSWKQQLASDIAKSVEESFSLEDFYHNLDSRGIDCSFGNHNIMFQVFAGYCGLNGERFCSNYKLMSYGDFSRENILNSVDYNDYNLKSGLIAIHQGGDIFQELAQLDIWGKEDMNIDMSSLYQAVIQEIEFKGKPWYQIQTIIVQLHADQMKQKLAREGLLALHEQKKQRKQQNIFLPSICNLLEEFYYWKYQKELNRNDRYREEELEDMWEL